MENYRSDLGKITIGIITYNEGNYLLEAWGSILFQTDDRWEAIMVLDGGTDRKKIFPKIEHPKLKKFVFKENQRPYIYLNKVYRRIYKRLILD